jgi:hypothetical protein
MSEIELRKIKVMGFSDEDVDSMINNIQAALEDMLGVAVSREGEPQTECLYEIEVTVARKPNA